MQVTIAQIIYEPTLLESQFLEMHGCSDLTKFKKDSHEIIANRFHNELKDVEETVYMRGIYRRD